MGEIPRSTGVVISSPLHGICTTLRRWGEVTKCYEAAAKYVNRQNGGQRTCFGDKCDCSFSSSFNSVIPKLYFILLLLMMQYHRQRGHWHPNLNFKTPD